MEDKFLHLLRKVYELKFDIEHAPDSITKDEIVKQFSRRFPELETYDNELQEILHIVYRRR